MRQPHSCKPFVPPMLTASLSVLFATNAVAITPRHVEHHTSTVLLATVLATSLGFIVRERFFSDNVARRPRFYIALGILTLVSIPFSAAACSFLYDFIFDDVWVLFYLGVWLIPLSVEALLWRWILTWAGGSTTNPPEIRFSSCLKASFFGSLASGAVFLAVVTVGPRAIVSTLTIGSHIGHVPTGEPINNERREERGWFEFRPYDP